MIALLSAVILGPIPWFTDDPLQPTVPPPLPTYIVQDDGTRMDCTPTLTYCWPDKES